MSQSNLSDFPEKVPGVDFEQVSDLQAIQLILKSALVAKTRGAYRYEEEITMYPAILAVRRILRDAAEQQQQQQKQQQQQQTEQKSEDKKVTLAPTVKAAAGAAADPASKRVV